MIKILNILCEGQTEQLFASAVLKPYMRQYGIIVKSFLVATSKNSKGGVISYQQVVKDLRLLMGKYRYNSAEQHFYTTMFDLYALPNDFPGFNNLNPDHYKYVSNIENAFASDINNPSFVPYIELHEFETLVLCNLESMKLSYPDSAKELDKLDKSWRKECNNNPELVNNKYDTSPSHRIINALGKKYHYNKPESGKNATINRIDVLRQECRHFGEWIEKLIVL